MQWERMPDTTVCPGDVASSGLLLDYGEVTSHAGKEWMEVKYAVGRRYWLILLGLLRDGGDKVEVWIIYL